MNSQTINKNTFIVRKEGVPNPIKGNISLSPDRKIAIFDSEPDLEPNTKYSGEINEGAKRSSRQCVGFSQRMVI